MSVEIEEEVCSAASSMLEGKTSIKLLEAGCGSASHIHFRIGVHAVGIDISEQELKKNSRLQERIVGDIQRYPLPREEFDVVVCWMVLEHLARPKDALQNIVSSMKPGGLLILGFPNLLSIKGIVTKFTPFWFHRLFYARIMRYNFHPFPTYLRMAITPKRIIRFAENNGATLRYFGLVEGRVSKRLRGRHWFINIALAALNVFLKGLSAGKLQPLLDCCALILQRTGSQSQAFRTL